MSAFDVFGWCLAGVVLTTIAGASGLLCWAVIQLALAVRSELFYEAAERWSRDYLSGEIASGRIAPNAKLMQLMVVHGPVSCEAAHALARAWRAASKEARTPGEMLDLVAVTEPA